MTSVGEELAMARGTSWFRSEERLWTNLVG